MLVLISTFSISIEKRFCGENLVDVAVFSEAKSCCEEIPKLNQTNATKKSCCKREIDFVKGQDNLVLKTLDDLDNIQKQVLFAFTCSVDKIYVSTPKIAIPHKHYSPPVIIRNIYVLDQTYLI
ncbi:MAG: hypothetical protein CMC76_10010 [Flavobacteriaceae bacterium]|nr:hypothetical protein [Flavobacteriaceae bacterium]MAX71418.1 hypothetical protein [Flavobacteriaceae bacterium]|tara:strand:+ start:1307 stop:1675 length:369 start_codon:yes stop_codon:yes gene_type:complete